jgi:predicted DNA-binding ribbon-helix-helix protein
MGRPPKGEHAGKIRSIRVEEALWNAAKDRAAARGETITDAITEFLHRYADGQDSGAGQRSA